MRITAAVTKSKGVAFALEPLELEEPRHDEVVVRIVGAGICHTDLIVRDQWYPVPLPAVLGHEGSGIVEAVGAGVTSVAPGDRVVLTYNSCGNCRTCLAGRPAYCDQIYAYNFAGTRPDGSTVAWASGEPMAPLRAWVIAPVAVQVLATGSKISACVVTPLALKPPASNARPSRSKFRLA